VHLAARGEDRARSQKGDAGGHRFDQAQGVHPERILVAKGNLGKLLADDDEQAGGDRDQHMRAQPGGFAHPFALEPDQAAQHQRRHQPRGRNKGRHGGKGA